MAQVRVSDSRAAFTRPVRGAAREPDLAGHTADVDDATRAPGGHPRRQSRHQEVRGADVAGEQGVERGDVEVGGRADPRLPRVVHQHVDVADRFDEARDVGGIAKVGGDEPRPAADTW